MMELYDPMKQLIPVLVLGLAACGGGRSERPKGTTKEEAPLP